MGLPKKKKIQSCVYNAREISSSTQNITVALDDDCLYSIASPYT